jgi:uncharacterized integral membrane protein (TIGR00698 family)
MFFKKTYSIVINYFPGVLASSILGILSILIGKFYFPILGPAPFAIIFGIVFGNTILKSHRYLSGASFCESELLSYSIVLLGANLGLDKIAKLGLEGFSFIILQIGATIIISFFICKKMGFSRKFSLLMGAGNAVCGSSAVSAASKVLKPKPTEFGIVITTVNVTGTFLMFILPLVIAPIFYKSSVLYSGALIGGVLQSVGQVVGAAAMMGEEVVTLAVQFKILRIMFMTIILIIFSHLEKKERNKSENIENNINEEKIKIFSIPWYIKGFLFLSVLATFKYIPTFVGNISHTIGSFFEIIALAGIGLKIKINKIIHEGPKALLAGGIIGIAQIIIAIFLIYFLL